MTHEELLEKIDYYLKPTVELTGNDKIKNSAIGFMKALRAVVELHKPVKDQWIDYVTCTGCRVGDDDYYSPEYPCETIQAIEKELQ